jgi:4-hydroxyacetophenone monooxygenase
MGVTLSDESASRHLTVRELEELTKSANVPTLLMVTYQVTGDDRWLKSPYRPTRSKGLGDHDTGGLPDAIQDEIRHAAAEAFFRLQEGEAPAIELPNADETSKMLGVCVGEKVDASYGVMFSEEFRRRLDPDGDQLPITPPPAFRVLVIGAGVSGIIAAQRLRRMGVDYLIVDKHGEPGGNWLDNPYPGAGVDTPSHLYSFSFAPFDWEKHFELRPELQEYLTHTFDMVGARERTLFNTQVIRAEFQEPTASWIVQLKKPDGSIETEEFQAIISAVGSLNRPKLPSVEGLEQFDGPSFHSSEWPADLDVTGKRVALIGSGASAMQIAPAIAERVEHLTIFQRTPPWVAPFEKFLLDIDPDARYLLRNFPIYRTWYWLKLYWQLGDKVLDSLRKDPEWPHPERAVNARNDGHRKFFTSYIRDELKGREDLLDKVIPTYPPYGKRMLLDNGWYRTLTRPNVTLVSDSVASVTRRGVVTESGAEYEADVLAWATGFEASRFVSSLNIIGRGGVTLRQAWDDDNPQAYLGVTVPDFPNLFLMGGPNSFPGSGSFMYFMEVQMRYIARLLEEMFEAGVLAVDVRRDRFDEYVDLVDRTAEMTVWTHPGTNTFFRNSRGRLVFVSPFRNVEYWTRAEDSGLADYHLLAADVELAV